ncbi:MAG: PAS domain-containing protein, partial [Candidatus Auribacterota bacterium]|nr:PAS domain-containing protein [Candidatus Auribacterota bacterium]
ELFHVRQKLTAAIKSDPLSTIFFAMEGLNEMVVITDLEHEIVYVNAACRGVLGYDPEELMGRKATEYFEGISGNPTDLAGKIAREAVDDSWEGEILNRCKDGGLITVRVKLTVIRSAVGEVLGYVGVTEDITERKQVLEQLQASEKRFRELTEMLPEGVFESDREMNLTYVNKKFYDLVGYSQEEFKRGLNALDMIVPEDRERARKTMARRLRGEDVGSTRYTGLRKDGSAFPILLRMNPFFYQDKPIGFRGVVVDLTEWEETQYKLKEYADNMEELVKVRSLEVKIANKELEKTTARQKILLDATFGREARMADLKKVIRKLREQIEDNGQVPVAADPLINGTE